MTYKTDEHGVLTEDEIDRAYLRASTEDDISYSTVKLRNGLRGVAKAQHQADTIKQTEAECQQRVEKILVGIENEFEHSVGDGRSYVIHIGYNDWQALKKREGIK